MEQLTHRDILDALTTLARVPEELRSSREVKELRLRIETIEETLGIRLPTIYADQ